MIGLTRRIFRTLGQLVEQLALEDERTVKEDEHAPRWLEPRCPPVSRDGRWRRHPGHPRRDGKSN